VFLQGVQVDSVSTSGAGVFATRTYTVTIKTGQLDLGLRNIGGDDPVINGLAIAVAAPATGPSKFDFGTTTSPAATGFTKVTPAIVYSPALGYGWLSGTIDSRDYPTEPDPLKRAFNVTSNGVFAVDVANGTYSVTVTMGSPGFAKTNMGVFLQGV